MSTAQRSLTGRYELDGVHSTVQFAVRHLTVATFRATFADVEASLVIDEDEARLEALVRSESISIVDPPEFREHIVRGGDFLAADAHPVMTFRSTHVALQDDGRATVSGELTIRDISLPVTAVGTYRPPTLDPFGGHRIGLELRSTIDRRSVGLSWQAPLPDGGDALGWEVEISVNLELARRT